MARILPLCPEAISQIQSSKQITSTLDVAVALLENSLDAGATKVDISVDFRRACCTIEDNGHGISLSEFSATGGLGKMYHTSKADDPQRAQCHGRSGVFLASLAALSLLSITSHHLQHEEHATLVLHNGRVLSRHIPAPQSHVLSISPMHGTRVEVRDLFGNLPVRGKWRMTETAGRWEGEQSWLNLKRAVAASVLAWPIPCAVKLLDQGATSGVFHTARFHSGLSSALTAKNLNQRESLPPRLEVQDAVNMLYQAGLATGDTRLNWTPLSASTDSVSVRGAICRQPVASKRCQFISVGIHPCPSSDRHNELYEAVNKAFTNSSFGMVDDLPGSPISEKKRRTHGHWQPSNTHVRKDKPAKRGIDRWPMFVLQVKLKDQRQHRLAAGRSCDNDSKAIVEVLDAAVMHWLSAYSYRPRKRQRRKQNPPQSPGSAVDFIAETSPLMTLRVGLRVGADLLTPQVRETSSRESAPASVKNKITDLSGVTRSGSARDQGTLGSAFSAWSRIKIGRNGFDDGFPRAKPPSNVPTLTQSSKAIQETAVNKSDVLFTVPTLEAGQFNTAQFIPDTYPDTRPTATVVTVGSAENETCTPSSDDYGSVDMAAMLAAAESEDALRESESTNISKVNSRIGVFQVARTADSGKPAAPPLAISGNLPGTYGRAMHLPRREAAMSQEQSGSWLPGFLKQWDNPVFQIRPECPIPVAPIDGSGVCFTEVNCAYSNHQHSTGASARTYLPRVTKLSKAALKSAKVISQVDRKFIVCKVPGRSLSDAIGSLVIVDQHAASERVILESLLVELCMLIEPSTAAAGLVANTGCRSAVKTSPLERPLRLWVSELEYNLFTRHAQHFAAWGILYDVVRAAAAVEPEMVYNSFDKRETREHRILVRALPPGIAERCTLSPKLLIELLRAEIWNLADNAKPHRPTTLTPHSGEEDEFPWLNRIGSCPKGIIDMLNSRACRSAIMFNDVLDVAQCEELMESLGRCAFPFMCAHGRTSMVPMIDLGENDNEQGGQLPDPYNGLEHCTTEDKCFSVAYKEWKGKDVAMDNETESE